MMGGAQTLGSKRFCNEAFEVHENLDPIDDDFEIQKTFKPRTIAASKII
jgi:hypothetical protein